MDFDYEFTLLTVRAVDGVHFCAQLAIAKRMAITASHGNHK